MGVNNVIIELTYAIQVANTTLVADLTAVWTIVIINLPLNRYIRGNDEFSRQTRCCYSQ